MAKIIKIGLIAALLITTQLFAQNISDEKYKLADSYEKSGDLKNASRLYEELLKSNPKVEKYFQGLVRTYKAQNKFSELLPIVENQIELNPKSVNYTLLGELLWRAGKTDEANNSWDKALTVKTDNIAQSFIDVAQAQLGLKLFDKAIATIQKCRKELAKPNFLAEEMSQLYIATGKYDKGTDEVFKLYNESSNLPQVEGKLQALMTNNEAITYIHEVLKRKTKESNDLNYLRLFAWFLRASKEYQEAYNINLQIDQLVKANGREMLNFAEESRRDSEFDIALKAFAYIIDKGKENPYLMNALFGYARTLEQKLNTTDKISSEFINSIIERYRNIIKDFPNTTTSFDCQYRIAFMYLNYFDEKDKAINELKSIIESKVAGVTAASASILLGDIYVLMDKLDEAEKVFFDVTNKFKKISFPEFDKAKFKIAEIEYFRGNIDSAKVLFGEISVNSSSDVANNALDKITLIEQNKIEQNIFAIYTKAELKERQKNTIEAINLFKQTIELAKEGSLVELCYIKIALLNKNRLMYEESISTLNSLLEKIPDTIYGDYVLLLIGDTYCALLKNELAIKSYTEILTKYPRSIYLQQARDKIRKLRS